MGRVSQSDLALLSGKLLSVTIKQSRFLLQTLKALESLLLQVDADKIVYGKNWLRDLFSLVASRTNESACTGSLFELQLNILIFEDTLGRKMTQLMNDLVTKCGQNKSLCVKDFLKDLCAQCIF